MNKIVISKQTREVLNIVQIKKGNYEHDFDKLVDSNGNVWLPDQLEISIME